MNNVPSAGLPATVLDESADKLPVNTQIAACYNVARPDFGPNWQIRAQVRLMSIAVVVLTGS
jgi:hypothetical protein